MIFGSKVSYLSGKLNFVKDGFLDFVHYDIVESDEGHNIIFEGDEKSDVLILVKELEFNGEDRLFLQKIVKAINRELVNSRLLILKGGIKIRVQDFEEYRHCKYLIAIGMSFKDLSIHINDIPYIPNNLLGKTLLTISPLEQISVDQNLKTKLWGALKHIFNV